MHQCFLLVFLSLCPHSDTLDTVGSGHYQPATDLVHSEHIYPQSHKSSIVFQLGWYIDDPLCKHLLDDQVILNHQMLPTRV